MELLEMMQNRRSVRSYTGETVSDECLENILNAGLLAPSGRRIRPWELIVVRDKDTLKKLSDSRVGSAKMLAGADAAIVVIADETKTDVWTEDCSIVMAFMHLMADSLGVGSCWIQGRLREAPDGRTTEKYVSELLGFEEPYRLEAILSLGMPESHGQAVRLSELDREKVHYERF